MVYRRALVLLGDPAEAEDATQEVFVRVLKNAGQFRKESSVSTWLYRITTNYCFNLLRNRQKRDRLLQSHHEDQMVPIAGTPEPSTAIVIRSLLAEAQEKQALAALYVYVDGMRREEVAQMLGCSIRTVGNLLERFNQWARQRLEEENLPAHTALRRKASLEGPWEETPG